jgi:uncharacterized protein
MAGALTAARSFRLNDGCRAFRRAMLILLFAALPVLSAPAFAEPVYPNLAGRVTDEAGLLSPDDKAEIDKDLAALEDTSTDQLAVVTVKSLQGYPIEAYGVGLGRKWGIGQKGKDNGVLLIVAPNDRKVRIEVGRRLEPFMTDTMSALIIENAILPKFRRGDFAGGIKDGIRDIKSVLLGDSEEVKRRAERGRTPEDDPSAIAHLVIFLLIVAFVIWVNYRQSQAVQSGMPGSQRRRGGALIIPGGSGNWGGGWSSGSGGGGWSGGGGGFGGGGASGSW